ncbi:MAG: GNAT family N-acetyltransferase [Ectothiorhodospiraceae bacterium]|jgi:RimJ/RimL family protein N-acetyltransferase
MNPLRLRRTREEELTELARMEQASDTLPFIVPYTLERHRLAFARDDVDYWSICGPEDQLLGFAIVALDTDGESVELRRIVVAEKGRGYGREAMVRIGRLCAAEYGRRRIWLDVFNFNERGRRLYETLGYRFLREEPHERGALRVYENELQPQRGADEANHLAGY